jgi:hypothetical protein
MSTLAMRNKATVFCLFSATIRSSGLVVFRWTWR